jgi:branched-chain amino acid transport system substrate-binding protein
VYPLPWVGPAVAEVARATITAWGRPPVVEIPDSLMSHAAIRSGLAGEVDYAMAMAAIPGVVAAVGPQSSRATLLVGRVYADRGIPVISATGTSRRLRDLGPWVFPLAPDGEAEGDFMARFIVDRLAVRRVTVFYLVADEYGLDLRDGVIQALRRRGVTPVDQVGIIETTDFPQRVGESLRRAIPDIVVVAARAPEAAAIARALHERLPGALMLVGDGVPLDATFARAAGVGAATSVYAVTWWHPDHPDTASSAFAGRYERTAGRPPSAAEAMYYDAIMLAAQAVRDVGPDGRAIRRYLSELGTARPPYRGIAGLIAFGPRRPVNLVMTRIKDGRTVMVDVSPGQP